MNKRKMEEVMGVDGKKEKVKRGIKKGEKAVKSGKK